MEIFVEFKYGEKNVKAFLKDTLVLIPLKNQPAHRHNYSEIHIICDGEIKYTIENQEYILKTGDAILIPKKKFHIPLPLNENAKIIAFQTDLDCNSVKLCKLSDGIFSSFINLFKEKETKAENVIPYIYWAINELFSDISASVKENNDYSFLIFEFFGTRYHENICLKDLAETLHISEKQTQRIIKRETGNTFLKELTFCRMRAADYFIKNSDLSLNQIAEYVGYNSYSGFWKAFNKYKNEKRSNSKPSDFNSSDIRKNIGI